MNRTEALAAATVVRDVEHAGRRIVVKLVPAWDERTEETHNGRTYYSGSYRPTERLELEVDGRPQHAGTQDADKLVKATVRAIDLEAANRLALPALRELVTTVHAIDLTDLPTAAEVGVRVGDVAWTHAQGRMRRGIVTKVARTNVTVAYTTASAPDNVYRPARPATGVLVEGRRASAVAAPVVEEEPVEAGPELVVDEDALRFVVVGPDSTDSVDVYDDQRVEQVTGPWPAEWSIAGMTRAHRVELIARLTLTVETGPAFALELAGVMAGIEAQA